MVTNPSDLERLREAGRAFLVRRRRALCQERSYGISSFPMSVFLENGAFEADKSRENVEAGKSSRQFSKSRENAKAILPNNIFSSRQTSKMRSFCEPRWGVHRAPR